MDEKYDRLLGRRQSPKHSWIRQTKTGLNVDIFIVKIFLKNLPSSISFRGAQPNPRIVNGEMRKFGSLVFWLENFLQENLVIFVRTQVIVVDQVLSCGLKHCPGCKAQIWTDQNNQLLQFKRLDFTSLVEVRVKSIFLKEL